MGPFVGINVLTTLESVRGRKATQDWSVQGESKAGRTELDQSQREECDVKRRSSLHPTAEIRPPCASYTLASRECSIFCDPFEKEKCTLMHLKDFSIPVTWVMVYGAICCLQMELKLPKLSPQEPNQADFSMDSSQPEKTNTHQVNI